MIAKKQPVKGNNSACPVCQDELSDGKTAESWNAAVEASKLPKGTEAVLIDLIPTSSRQPSRYLCLKHAKFLAEKILKELKS